MKHVTEKVAGICGLFCGTCPAYPETCEGCMSDKLAEHCAVCVPGFRACAREHNVIRCHECGEFPCSRLEQFSHEHIVNGICHHTHIIDNLQYMKDYGIDAFLDAQVHKTACPECGEFNIWYETECRRCGWEK